MIIHYVPRLIKRLFPRYVWNKSREEAKVYLTFDDGPVPEITPYILDQLSERGMKATFFMVGDNVKKYPEIAQRVVEEGHQIGNHTFNHLQGNRVNTATYINNVSFCNDIIQEVTGKVTGLFRPPYGRLKRSQLTVLSDQYQIIMWDVLSGDYDPRQPPKQCLSKTIKYTQNGSIILFHDQLKTVSIIKKVLPSYLDYLQDQKYQTEVL
ncbi:polysaccharide deacetylase family protein [Echinicola sp. CAU 1574]|uniref:Polysaccharide deacetylase family protein n=1 Tax=Echinicola arenosa TaxID=2774144 RepID=A0ABR9AQ05_9BACT|nr:polysaccharide deacetylase family protein [Echinicola arenosa]MBD8490416.1 polysaccharide deacetylase family protein [Echinicola arenosa]